MRRQHLDGLFDPRSVTIVGASADPAKWGHILAGRALDSCSGRPVALVNRAATSVRGHPSVSSLAEARTALGEPLDLVVVCVPAASLVPTVADAVAAGARSLVVISAGLAELGPDGAALEREAVALARAGGAVLVGPNCLGLVDTGAGLQLTHDLLPPGEVAVLSQSGNVVLDLAGLLADRDLGISRFVSVGNQADLGTIDLMASCLEHDGTRAVAVYAEDVVDGRAFVAAARALVEAGKPVVLLAPGRSAAAVRSAVSHTGSLTTASAVLDAACAAAGAHRVEHPTALADLLVGLLADRRRAGPRVAVVTDGGGHGAIAADALAAVGLDTPVLGQPTRDALRACLGPAAVLSDPVDLAGAGERDPMRYTAAVATLLAADEVDAVLLTGYFGGYSATTSSMAALETEAARAMADAVRGQAKPLAVHTLHPSSPTARLLHAAGVPVHRDVDRACAVLAGLAAPAARQLPSAGTALPPPAAPVTDPSYAGSRALFEAAGVRFAAGRTVLDAAGLEAALAELSGPLVLKALGRQHKSDGGGVLLGLTGHDQTRAGYADLVARLDPPAVSVEEMADTAAGVEVIVGSVADPRFGPVLMVGLGGILAEVLADTALALAPVGADEARTLLLSLRGAAVLQGVRGRAAADLAALAALVARVSEVAAAHPELAELELNPVLATPTGVLALDARVVLAGQPADPTSRR